MLGIHCDLLRFLEPFGGFLETEFSLLDPPRFDDRARRVTYFHQKVLFLKTKHSMLGLFKIFVEIYQRSAADESNRPRPKDVQQGNWIEHISAKRKAKWVMPLSDHIASSQSAMEKAYASPKGCIWYFLHAIYLLLPWWPVEWYMAEHEARLTGLQALVEHILVLILAWQGYDSKAGATTAGELYSVLLDLPFTSASTATKVIHVYTKVSLDFDATHADKIDMRDPFWVDHIYAYLSDRPELWPTRHLLERLGDLDPNQPWRPTEAGDFSILEACSIWWNLLSTEERKRVGCHLCPTCIAIKWIKKLKAAGKEDPWTLTIPELVGESQGPEEIGLGYRSRADY